MKTILVDAQYVCIKDHGIFQEMYEMLELER